MIEQPFSLLQNLVFTKYCTVFCGRFAHYKLTSRPRFRTAGATGLYSAEYRL